MSPRWRALCRALLGPLLLGPPALARPQHPKWPPQSYAIYYGRWDEETVRQAQEFDCVILHPGPDFTNINPALIKKLQAGKDGKPGTADDVITLGYVSIGEDEKVPASHLRVPGQTSGPMIEESPGKWVCSNRGYPPKYLDEWSYVFDEQGQRRMDESGKPLLRKGHDGIPDENGVWGSYYTFAGDPGWRDEVLGKLKRLQDEMGVDGFFLDTLDTASPFGAYGGTQAHMAELVQLIRARFPQRLIVANRGMFLLDRYAEQFGANIDGMLFESLYTVWDWSRSQGVPSPYGRGDYEVLQRQVLPASRKFGFFLLFINYLNPEQADFIPLAQAAHDLVASAKGAEYLADPSLARLYPPPSRALPSKSGEKPPRLGQPSVKELGQGRFRLQFELTGLGERRLGKDYFLDLRFSERPADPAELGLLPAIPVDYRTLQGGKVTVESHGLEKAGTYHFYLRGLGRAQDQHTPPAHLTLAASAPSGPGPVQALEAVGREKSVRLHWKGTQPGYRVYQGDSPTSLTPGPTTNKPEYLATGLDNGRTYYFAVAGVGPDGREGVLSRPLAGQPQPCTPPTPPDHLEVKTSGRQLSLRWASTSPRASLFKVYCVPRGETHGIPVRLSATECLLNDLAPGDYWVAVSAVDGSGNESPLSEKTMVTVP